MNTWAPIALLCALAIALAGCHTAPISTGQQRDAVLQTKGQPTARYALPEGAERLEYAAGPWGRTTWMIDVDATGRVRSSRQVLNEAAFAEFQARAPGLSRTQLLLELGTPGARQAGGRAGGQVWSWRYPTNDCLWFQVSLNDAAVVTSAGYGIDPTCDGTSDRN
jgi:hypothetical protein